MRGSPVSVVPSNPETLQLDDDDDSEWNFIQFLLIFIFLCIFLSMSLVLTIIWVTIYHDAFKWKTHSKHMFSFHPVFMVGGFVTLGGFSLVLFRVSPCCGRTTMKVSHLLVYVLIIPCIIFGLYTVVLVHDRPDFTLIHTWIGLVTIVLFATEFVLGILAYGILLAFGYSVEYVRLGMMAIHACTGKITFMLSIGACLTGLSLKQAQDNTSSSLEFLIINFIGICIMLSALMVMSILRR